MKVVHIVVVVLLAFCCACSDDPKRIESGQSEHPEEPRQPQEEEEEFDFEAVNFKEEVTVRSLLRFEFDESRFEFISREADEFYSPILAKRRTVVDMRAGQPGTVNIDLVEAAGLRWDNWYDHPEFRYAVEGDTVYSTSLGWIYNPLIIDCGPVYARSVSPTQIQILRKTEVAPDQKPVEIPLERSLVGMVPYEYGVRATIVVELTDTPADSRDSDKAKYITMKQADALGLYHIPFDSEEFRAPILEGGSMTVELEGNNTPLTVELKSPAQILTYSEYLESVRTISGMSYYDYNVEEWIFNPTFAQIQGVEARMVDPYHLTVCLLKDISEITDDELTVSLYRGDFWQASDAGETRATLKVKIKK